MAKNQRERQVDGRGILKKKVNMGTDHPTPPIFIMWMLCTNVMYSLVHSEATAILVKATVSGVGANIATSVKKLLQ